MKGRKCKRGWKLRPNALFLSEAFPHVIPNILHFIFGMAPDFGGKPFSLVHYLAIKSAVELNRPDAAWMHYEYEPEGEWWDRARPLLRLNQVKAPGEIFGNRLHHVAHQADVVRLEVLKNTGGVYLDLDTISVKPVRDLLGNSFVIGQEMRAPFVPRNTRQKIKHAIRKRVGLEKKKPEQATGLCNAVLLSEKDGAFVTWWLDSYQSFRSKGRDRYWNEHSVRVPEQLAVRNPDQVTILEPQAFHYPLYNEAGLRAMFEENHLFPRAYLHHLWESFSWDRYLAGLDPNDLKQRDTTYSRLARPFLSS